MKFSDIKEGMTIVANNGFWCLHPGLHTVRRLPSGELYVECELGVHVIHEDLCDEHGNIPEFDYTNGEGPYRSGYYH